MRAAGLNMRDAAKPNTSDVAKTSPVFRFAFSSTRRCHFLFAALLIIFVSPPVLAESAVERHAALERTYAAHLENLAVWCQQQGLAEEAATTRAWIKPDEPLTLLVAVPAKSADSAAQIAGAGKEWATRFGDLRQSQAKSLHELALAAAEAREFTLAYQWLHAVLREDPEHAAVRKLLGYKQYEGKWLTQYEYNKARSNQVWTRFGWLPRKHVARYEAGERFYKNGWITADEDARSHANIDRPWEIGTEHFQLRTDASLEEGARFAALLEEFYGVWRQAFVRFLFSDEQLDRLFREGRVPIRRARPHQVICYRDRAEYNAALVREYPNIDITRGFYLGRTRTAYFFAGPEQDVANIYHEATHQLFSESSAAPEPGQKANFWVVEGIACLAESYRAANHLALLGGAEALRLKNARVRLLRDEFYIGLAELCDMGMQALQTRDHLKQVYSQSAGVTYYLMFADDGRHRRTLVDYLAAVYANRDRADTLSTLMRASFSKLDEQYQHFIRNLP